jgi:type I restriction enzyme S subunit
LRKAYANNWSESVAEVTLGALSDAGMLAIGDGYRTKRAEHGRPGYRILRVADVADGHITLDGDDFVHMDYRRAIGAKLSQPGDVLLTTKGTVGRVAIYPEHAEQVVYSPQLCYFRINDSDSLNPRFLAYWFKSESFEQQASHRANNTDMAAYINLRDIRSLQLSVPSIEEQRAIADVLGALDDKIIANERVACVALELARTMFGRQIEGVPRTPMSTVIEPVLGGTPPRTEASMWDGSVAWASAKDIAGASYGVILSTAETITELAASMSRTRTLPVGTVVLTARGTVGAVARLGIPAAINQSCYAFVPGVVPQGCLFLVVEEAAKQAQSLAHGSVFDTITMRTFDHVGMPALDWPAWQSIEQTVEPALSASQQAVSESSTLAAMRDDLLPLLISGQVRVRDAKKVVEEVV